MKRYIVCSSIYKPSVGELVSYMKRKVPEDIKYKAANIWRDWIVSERYEEYPGLEELFDLTDAIDSYEDQQLVRYALGIIDEDEYNEGLEEEW